MFNSYPFLRYAIFLAIGIFVQDLFSLPHWLIYSLQGGMFIIFLLTSLLQWVSYERKTLVSGLAGMCLMIVTGAAALTLHQKVPDRQLYEAEAFAGVLTDGLEEASRGYKTTIRLDRIKTGVDWITVDEQAVIFLRCSKGAYQYGDRVVAYGKLHMPKPAMNPGAFDYQLYLKRKEIFALAYLNEDQCRIIKKNCGNTFTALSISWRQTLADYFHRLVPGKNEASIATALVLGVKGKLDEELRADYANSGTLHVLAVSGMHVGLIYAMLTFLLSWLKKVPYGKFIFAGVIIGLLLLYAMLTGMSASVLRAVAMCCLIVLAETTGRRSLVFNTVFLSAFILLCLDPFIIYDVGFQLSYAAVMGIVCWQKPLYDSWEAPNKVLDWLWQTCSVTLTAQLAVAPLGMLYFKQFPNMFWLSNLVVIPASTLVLFMGIAMLCCWPFPMLASLTGQLIAWAIDWINAFVHWLNKIPFAVTNDIFINPFQAVLLCLALVCISVFILNRKKLWFWPVAICCWLFVITGLLFQIKGSEKEQLIIPHTFKAETILLQKGFNQQLIGWDTENASKILRKDANELVALNRHSELINTFDKADSILLLTVGNKKITWLKGKIKPMQNPLKTDLLIVSSNAIVSLKQANYFFTFKELIIHPSYSYRLAERLAGQARKAGVKVWNMHESGYYHTNLSQDL